MVWCPLLTDNERKESFASYQKDYLMCDCESKTSESTSARGSCLAEATLNKFFIWCALWEKDKFWSSDDFKQLFPSDSGFPRLIT